MPLHARVDIRDEPGVLAEVTAALARAGADVLSVQVTDRSAGRAVDDFLLGWPAGADPEPLTAALQAVGGSRLLGLRRVATVPEDSGLLDLLTQVLWQPQRAVQTLADLVPSLLPVDWSAVLLRGATGRLLYAGAAAPQPVPALPADFPRALACTVEAGDAAVVPLPRGELVLVAVRRDGPPFLRREVDDLVRTAEVVLLLAEALRTGSGPGRAPRDAA